MSENKSMVVKGLIRMGTIFVTGMMILFIIAAIKAPIGAHATTPAPSAPVCSTAAPGATSQTTWHYKTTAHKLATHHKKTVKTV